MYEAPASTVVEVKTEGVICQSVLKTLWIGSLEGDSYLDSWGSSLESRESGGSWGGNDW